MLLESQKQHISHRYSWYAVPVSVDGHAHGGAVEGACGMHCVGGQSFITGWVVIIPRDGNQP